MRIGNNILYDVYDKDIINDEFVIPDGVTAVGNYAFGYCLSLIHI